MQLYKIFYWPADELMHRETIRTMFREADSKGKLIRELMESGLNVEKVVPYTQEEYEREMQAIQRAAGESSPTEAQGGEKTGN